MMLFYPAKDAMNREPGAYGDAGLNSSGDW